VREVIIDDHVFVINRLDPKRAFHVMRRLAPLVGALREFIPFMLGDASFDPNDLDTVTRLAEPVARGISEMPEADADYVIDTCLSVIQVRLPENQNILTPVQSGTHLMYDWITMPMMVRLVVQSVIENLQGFSPAGARAS
jgi:hypothetical protein